MKIATKPFCPHTGCDYRGWVGLTNLRANGHPNGGPWRQLYCRSCHGYFLETHGTIVHGKRLSVELLVRVLACRAEGLGKACQTINLATSCRNEKLSAVG
jgi:hypothetical protein